MSTSDETIQREPNPDESGENQEIRDGRGRFRPGFSGNPLGVGAGRPRGKTLKEYDKERFMNMSDEQKEEFLLLINPEMRYKMAEGNPATESNVDATVKIIIAQEDDSLPSPDNNTEGQPPV